MRLFKYKKDILLIILLIVTLTSLLVSCRIVRSSKLKDDLIEGKKLINANDYENAIPLLESTYKKAQKTIRKKDLIYSEITYQLASLYDQTKAYDKAISFYVETIDNINFEEKDNLDLSINIYQRLGTLFRLSGKYEESIKYLKQCLIIIEDNYGIINKQYNKTLEIASITSKRNGDYNNAIDYNSKSSEIIKSLYGEDSNDYAISLTSLSQIYLELGNYEKAQKLLQNSMSILDNKEQRGVPYLQTIFTLSVLHHNKYDYVREISLLNEAKSIAEKMKQNKEKSISNIGDIAYMSANNNLSVAYTEKGDFENALKIALEVANSTPENNAEHPTRMQNLAFNYAELGDFDKAIEIYEVAKESCKNKLGNEHPLYAKLIDCIGQLYFLKGDLDKSKVYFQETLSIFLQNFDKTHHEYGFYLNNYTNTLLELNEFDEAINLINENISISEDNSNTNNLSYYRKKLSLANAFIKKGNFDKALNILNQYSEKVKNQLGDKHPDYGDMLNSLSRSYIGLGELDKAIPVIENSNKIHINQIDNVFKFRSEKEKKSFLKLTSKKFDEIQSIGFKLNNKDHKLNEINLDNQIMLKGLLLNNSKNVLSQLSALNDSDINGKINNYRKSKNKLINTLTLNYEDRIYNEDSLREDINLKETELVKIHSSRFDQNLNIKSSWRSSQAKLTEEDIAIEFSHFNYTNQNKATDSINYVAYVYKQHWEYPIVIPLFEEKQLKKIIEKKSPNKLYSVRGSKVLRSVNTEGLYDLVWKPIEKYLDSCKRVYFSPSGLLNQIAFAAINKKGEETLSKEYNLFQLSSTGVLSDGFKNPSISTALFIGGIDYNYNSNSNSININPVINNSGNFTKIKSNKNRGDSWDFLEGTLNEVKQLQLKFKNSGLNETLWTGSEATESNFKALSGNSPKLLHIATHGFFYENKLSDNKNNNYLNIEDRYRLAEDPLLRSGLLFVGANNTWKKGHSFSSSDDGILTALEISNMDLSNTDIVVLSACETGLGDIDGSEGVYGLQRAFKMAGVDIIIMSLWQVPDIETTEFMDLLYTYWIQLKNVREAFIKTQKIMQEKYNDDPFKWAAFVLVE